MYHEKLQRFKKCRARPRRHGRCDDCHRRNRERCVYVQRTDFAERYRTDHCPGFYQEGRISDLKDEDITQMVNVGFLGAAMLMKRVFMKQDELHCFVAITSTSQFTPRQKEPVYTGVKAALGMFANSLSLDGRIEKTLVVAPAGMKTKFWHGIDKDMSTMLDPAWVANQIRGMLNTKFSYLETRVLRDPPRVEVVQKR